MCFSEHATVGILCSRDDPGWTCGICSRQTFHRRRVIWCFRCERYVCAVGCAMLCEECSTTTCLICPCRCSDRERNPDERQGNRGRPANSCCTCGVEFDDGPMMPGPGAGWKGVLCTGGCLHRMCRVVRDFGRPQRTEVQALPEPLGGLPETITGENQLAGEGTRDNASPTILAGRERSDEENSGLHRARSLRAFPKPDG